MRTGLVIEVTGHSRKIGRITVVVVVVGVRGVVVVVVFSSSSRQ
jgi:hypothetical protein